MVERKRLKPEDLVEDPAIDVVEDKPKPGRPALYDPKFAPIAKVLCSRGATSADLADAFGVSTVSIYNWESWHPEFGEAVRLGKVEIFDPRVERALAERALGYSVDTEEIKVTKDGDVLRIPVRKHYPPETTACIFWLKNRQPQKWRDVWKIEHEGKVELEKLTAAELLEEIRKEASSMGLLSQMETLGVAPASKNGKGNGVKH